MSFICIECNKVFIYNCHLVRHQNKKIKCSKKINKNENMKAEIINKLI